MLAFAQSTSGDHAKSARDHPQGKAINPRHENYRFNLANIYLATRQPDKTMAILQSLQQTVNLETAAQVAGAIQNFREFQQLRASDVGLIHREDAAGTEDSTEVEVASSAPATQGPKWMLQSSSAARSPRCIAPFEPSAILTMASGSKTTKLRIC